jgi:hypothetical protein
MSQEQTSHNAKDFVAGWKWVWSKFACLPNFDEDFAGRLFVDILNEPDSQGQGWQPKEGRAGAFCVVGRVSRQPCARAQCLAAFASVFNPNQNAYPLKQPPPP